MAVARWAGWQGAAWAGVRELAASFVVSGPCGVAVRDRLKLLTAQEERVLRVVGYACVGRGWVNDPSEGNKPLMCAEVNADYPELGVGVPGII
ncbi:hypothetical protein ACFYWN_29885 [Streptomyces sp. NPDC002917]|uniref:hypothetical protein n=1 Tax=Streptomyces sp. NPDC002917 TaxID=3364671 RepID=UPI00369C9124